jgi:hypothetical protein
MSSTSVFVLKPVPVAFMAKLKRTELAGHSDRYASHCRGRSINRHFGSILSIVCRGTIIRNAGVRLAKKTENHLRKFLLVFYILTPPRIFQLLLWD